MALTIVVFGLIAIEAVRAGVLAQQAHAIAQSLAIEILYATQSADPGHPSMADQEGDGVGVARDRLDVVARASGFSPQRFHQLRSEDVAHGPLWARVTVRARDFKATSQTVTAYGVHAGRIEAGARRVGPDGVDRPTGCLPLGIQLSALTGEARETELNLRGEVASAHCVRFDGERGDPLAWVRYLGGRPGDEAAGEPPPAAEVGRRVSRTEADADFVKELRERFEGRVAVVPLLHHDMIMGFGRVRVVEVNGDTGALKISLAPSSVLPGASVGPVDNRSNGDSAYPVGRVLAAQVRHHS